MSALELQRFRWVNQRKSPREAAQNSLITHLNHMNFLCHHGERMPLLNARGGQRGNEFEMASLDSLNFFLTVLFKLHARASQDRSLLNLSLGRNVRKLIWSCSKRAFDLERHIQRRKYIFLDSDSCSPVRLFEGSEGRRGALRASGGCCHGHLGQSAAGAGPRC